MLVLRICLILLLFPTFAQAQLSNNIRLLIEGFHSVKEPMIAGRYLQSPKLLSDYYLLRGHQPIWTGAGPLTNALPELLVAIQDSAKHGLNPERYYLSLLSEGHKIPSSNLELLATDAFLTLVNHRSSGVVSTLKPDLDWYLQPDEEDPDPVTVLQQLVESGDGVQIVLSSLWPNHPEYTALLEERVRILSTGEITTVQVPDGQILKPGQSNKRIALLKTRLFGPGEYSDEYDDSLRVAVQSFQAAAGLEPDGIVGQATIEVLNATPVSWVDKIDANLERWRWLPRKQPQLMIRVNIAGFHLRVIRNWKNEFTMKVVVGKPYRNTPVFTENLKYMVLNPYWNVPYKLVNVDKIPLLKTDPMKLGQQGFEVQMPGSDKFVSVSEIDWSKVSSRGFNGQLRQRPGPSNALGKIKFMFPNRFSIYLHDTNDRDLFNKVERSFSSGCIRLSEPVKLARWLLSNEGRDKEAANIETLISKGETTVVHFKQAVPVYIVYFTAFMDDAGDIVFKRDLYKRDKAIVDGLRNPN